MGSAGIFRAAVVQAAPVAFDVEATLATMQHVACEGRCFVLSANQFARRRDYPDDYPIGGDHQPDDVLWAGAPGTGRKGGAD